MDINYKIKENGKPSVTFSKEGHWTGFSFLTEESFSYNKQNLFLHEIKRNGNNLNKNRCFTISIRQDGRNRDVGKYKMAQMNLDKSL